MKPNKLITIKIGMHELRIILEALREFSDSGEERKAIASDLLSYVVACIERIGKK